jgi:hypothetical protein
MSSACRHHPHKDKKSAPTSGAPRRKKMGKQHLGAWSLLKTKSIPQKKFCLQGTKPLNCKKVLEPFVAENVKLLDVLPPCELLELVPNASLFLAKTTLRVSSFVS